MHPSTGLVLPSPGPDWHVAERPAGRPVALAVLAEVPRLVHVIVVVVTELRVLTAAPRAWHHLLHFLLLALAAIAAHGLTVPLVGHDSLTLFVAEVRDSACGSHTTLSALHMELQ
jgi:hypothetical protein